MMQFACHPKKAAKLSDSGRALHRNLQGRAPFATAELKILTPAQTAQSVSRLRGKRAVCCARNIP
jgi:hypothetical protein